MNGQNAKHRNERKYSLSRTTHSIWNPFVRLSLAEPICGAPSTANPPAICFPILCVWVSRNSFFGIVDFYLDGGFVTFEGELVPKLVSEL